MEDFSMDGDLGFGMGLKPGGILIEEKEPDETISTRLRRKHSSGSDWKLLARRKSSTDIGKENQGLSHRLRSNSYCGTWELSEEGETNTLKYKGAELFRKLKKRFSSSSLGDCNRKRSVKLQDNQDSKYRESKLAEAQQTILVLQGKLEIYKELLQGKYKASEVLLDKLLESLQEQEQSKERYMEESRDTNKEINTLQFQLHLTEGNLTDAQRTWLERFDHLVKENSELSSTLKTQAEIIKKLTIKNAVLKRDRDELLSLQDTKEKLGYETLSVATENETVTAMELAILGACKCRDLKQKPCSCAKAAAVKHRTIMALQSYLDEFQQEKQDLSRLVQLYQNAFEEQLKRNRLLTKKVLLRNTEYDILPKPKLFNGTLRLRSQNSNCTEAVDSLVDLVCDRTDALLKQQLLTKMLTQKVTELENLKLQGTNVQSSGLVCSFH